MTKIVIIAVLTAQIAILPTLAYANTPQTTIIEAGQPAPYDGLLLNLAAQAKVIAEKKKIEEKCALETNYLKMRGKTDCDLQINRAKVELDALQKKYEAITSIKEAEIRRLQDIAIKNKSNDKWWLTIGVVGGIVATVAVFFAASYAIKAIR